MSDWELEFDELNELAEKSQFKKLKAILDEKNEMDVAEFISQLPHEKALATFRILQKDLASDVFACMEPDQQEEIVSSISDTELNLIIEDLATDDAVDLVEEMPANVARRILRLATAQTRNQINQYLKYPGKQRRQYYDQRICGPARCYERAGRFSVYPAARCGQRDDLHLLCN